MAKKKLTLEETVKLHRKLWKWLSRHPFEFKNYCPKYIEVVNEYGYYFQNECFMCEYVKQIRNENDEYFAVPDACGLCPLDWTDGGRYPMRKICAGTGLYAEWYCVNDNNILGVLKKMWLARKIAKLPLKKEYKEAMKRC